MVGVLCGEAEPRARARARGRRPAPSPGRLSSAGASAPGSRSARTRGRAARGSGTRPRSGGRRAPRPVAKPVNICSEIGMSSTRSGPNSSRRPLVTPRSEARTSSPTTKTLGSAAISSRSALPSAGRYRTCVTRRRPARGRRPVAYTYSSASAGSGRGLSRANATASSSSASTSSAIRSRSASSSCRARPRDRVADAPLLDLLVGAVAELHRPLGGVVAEEAVGPALEERRAPARAGARDRARGRLEHRVDVHAVDPLGRHAVGGGAVDERAGGRALLRQRDGVAVVLADEDERQLPERGEVHRLVQHALVGAAVAEERHGDPAGAVDARSSTPRRPRTARPRRRCRSRRRCRAQRSAMCIEPPRAAVEPVDAAEQLRHHPPHVRALGDQVAVPAMGRRDHVVGTQRRADTRRDRLLPDVLVRHAGDLVRVHELDHPLLEAADQEHRAVELGAHPNQKRRAALPPRTAARPAASRDAR